ncbi:hypothetical protein M8C21_013631 [Ambrosia artemisiifolia]|uniref:Proline-rich protein PRCC n=1 Tax=Ambrosia artemisiifolia TaxID=4212 RepID=A0AAD5GUL1_AMBAR|nr:hypothetical protein M8C21_013631 [Ambrosia artemisiifolia]
MDSLLATYASSDEEDDQSTQTQPIQSKLGEKLFSSLPPPSASLFSKLPQPKPKKVVQFRPPLITKLVHHDDQDHDNNNNHNNNNKEEETKKDDDIPQAPSVKSFLSSIPAPRNSGSLGAGSSSAGAGGRRYNEYANATADYGSYDYSVINEGYQNVETDYSGYGPAAPGSVEQGNYEGYESKWIDRSGGNVVAEIPVAQPPLGKRCRNEIPAEVIEVNQDELMKNRPRPDQAKFTGIAFGPSYQPTSSTKGKPSKLHKRKHQIGSLYFDMRSKEAELAERRSKGFLTKAETQAKYGW